MALNCEPKQVALGEVTKWLSGGTPSKSNKNFWSGDVPWISAFTLKTIEIFKSDQNVTKEAVLAGSKMAPVNATLLLVRGSALHNEIRVGMVISPVCFNQDVKALIPCKKVHPKFLTYAILGREDDILKLVSSAGNTAGVLDTKLVQAFEIWLPSISEQRTIVTALSDMDALLVGLDQLIAKKRDLKQATMQQLLTGKTRLPGFCAGMHLSGDAMDGNEPIEGEWEVKRLGQICTQVTTGKLDANAMKKNGQYRFYTCAKNYCFIDSYAFDSEALLISGNGANVGYIHYYKGKFNAYQRTYVLTGFLVDIKYIQHYLNQRLDERIEVEVKAGGTPYIMKDTLTEMPINLPPTIEEQTAIATILSNMDAEIEALQQRRTKTRDLKQAMMQELLTGKTRLISNKEC